MGVVLGIYLSRSGHSAFQIGAVLAFGLAGSACATTVVGIAADRVGRKRFLVLLSILTALGGLSLYALPKFPLLLALALVAMLNGTGTERSAIFALERSAAAVETASPFCLVVPIVPSAMLSWDFVRDRAIRDLQIENPLHAILSGWFVEPENCGSPASRSWHFQSLPVAKPKLTSLLSSRPSFVVR